MKNKEKYAKEIIEIACSGNAVAVSKVNGKPIACENNNCKNCYRYNDFYFCEEERFKEWAESEYIEKPVISKRDITFLDYLDKELKYIARDENGELSVYKTQPIRNEMYCNWVSDDCLNLYICFNVDFSMVKCEDSEPWLIEDLKKLEVVEEYEK